MLEGREGAIQENMQSENERIAAQNELEKAIESTEVGQALKEIQKAVEKDVEKIREAKKEMAKQAVGGILGSIYVLRDIETMRLHKEILDNFVSKLSGEERQKLNPKINEVRSIIESM